MADAATFLLFIGTRFTIVARSLPEITGYGVRRRSITTEMASGGIVRVSWDVFGVRESPVWRYDIFLSPNTDCMNTEGGNGNGGCCQLPFIYKKQLRHHCVVEDNARPWCSLTTDYDNDGVWGYCAGKINKPEFRMYQVLKAHSSYAMRRNLNQTIQTAVYESFAGIHRTPQEQKQTINHVLCFHPMQVKT